MKVSGWKCCWEIKLRQNLKQKMLLKNLFITLIKIYQKVFSLLLGGNKCRFYPTCSNYMIEAIAKKGLIKGFFMGILRVLNCHPFSKKDRHDPVK